MDNTNKKYSQEALDHLYKCANTLNYNLWHNDCGPCLEAELYRQLDKVQSLIAEQEFNQFLDSLS